MDDGCGVWKKIIKKIKKIDIYDVLCFEKQICKIEKGKFLFKNAHKVLQEDAPCSHTLLF